MIVYTAEDFAQAMFAEHPDPDAVDARYAARMSRDPEYPWLLDGVPGNGDEHMARDGWVPVVESRITLDALEAAWEAAEVADECREGDVLIIRDDEDNYLVRRMDDRSDLDSTARILSRAPKREPWAELAGVLKAHTGEPDPDETARMLYENGVRVTGGEES